VALGRLASQANTGSGHSHMRKKARKALRPNPMACLQPGQAMRKRIESR
jgi:hypothetical protein